MRGEKSKDFRHLKRIDKGTSTALSHGLNIDISNNLKTHYRYVILEPQAEQQHIMIGMI